MKFLGHISANRWAPLTLELYATGKNVLIHFTLLFIYSKYMGLAIISSRCCSSCWGNNKETDIEDLCFQGLSSLGRRFQNL